ncbi:MAG TPA: DUF1214 domain-containing protein [Acidimicrobiales bacterium]|jgi:hypothetical protein|nr:DUF1214 domain-containing protein [Acidimicrobiales bacterium]
MWNPVREVRKSVSDAEVRAGRRQLEPVVRSTGSNTTVRASTAGGVPNRPGFRPLTTWEVPPVAAGRHGDDAALPAQVTQMGLVATELEENIFSTTYQQVDGTPLDGSHRYELRFRPAELSDAGQFWSVTMYGLDCDLAEKRIDRYSVGDRTPWLRTDREGGMTLVLQHERPDDEGVLNWLPAPEGGFCLVFRAYGPGRSVIDGEWTPPVVRMVA